MAKPLLATLWEAFKIVGTMCLTIGFMRCAVLLGATPLEAGFSAVVVAVVWAAFLVSRVVGVIGDSFHPKVDELMADVGDLRRRQVP
jgi:hypothetical protein